MSYSVVIPARFGSERLPGKPLADIHGRPMILWVAEAVGRSRASRIVVATDDERIREVVAAAGVEVVMTDADHPSGSDRVMEAVANLGLPDDGIVLNVQGDEPMIPGVVLDQLADALAGAPDLAAATLCERLTDFASLSDPNLVKVVKDTNDRALYFSRAAIPHARDSFAHAPVTLPDSGRWWRHIGVYAYRVWALKRFVALPVGMLEALEKLEQLRLLENGMTLEVKEACEKVPGGVDTEQDLMRIRDLLGPG